MRAHHVVVETRPALILAGALGTLEGGRHALAADEVVVHAPDTATLELAFLLWWCVCVCVCVCDGGVCVCVCVCVCVWWW